MNQAIRVEGLNEFQRAVKVADKRFATELRQGLNEAASLVARTAAPHVPVRSGRLRASIKARSTQREGRTVMGSNAVPYAGWWEFGGRVGINKSVVRDRVPQGRVLYPAFVQQRLRVQEISEQVLRDTARKAGLK